MRIIKSKETHSEYAILIDFLLQQWLHKNSLMLRYTHIGCVVNFRHERPSEIYVYLSPALTLYFKLLFYTSPHFKFLKAATFI
jgi:hypothetical protein